MKDEALKALHDELCETDADIDFGKLRHIVRRWEEMNTRADESNSGVEPELLALIERVKWLIDDGVRYQRSFSDMATYQNARADRARLADYLNKPRPYLITQPQANMEVDECRHTFANPSLLTGQERCVYCGIQPANGKETEK
jgi:hypothetical protein